MFLFFWGGEGDCIKKPVIANSGSQNLLFHNHEPDERLRYRYPLIQYKRIHRKAAIICVGVGVSAFGLHQISTTIRIKTRGGWACRNHRHTSMSIWVSYAAFGLRLSRSSCAWLHSVCIKSPPHQGLLNVVKDVVKDVKKDWRFHTNHQNGFGWNDGFIETKQKR